MNFKVLIHASEVLTGAGVRARDGRQVREEDLGRIPDGALVYSTKKVGKRILPDRVEWVGSSAKLPKRFARASKRDLRGKYALIPGLIDCHTHLVFAGDRSEEFAARCAGATYEEIAARGGGIVSTMKATREASPSLLRKLAVSRLKEMASYGVRTIEVKSGYGLSFESELKILQVVKTLQTEFPELTLVPTFLGAHAFPPDCSREEYLSELKEKMLPAVVRGQLADACDVFVDKGYYTAREARSILGVAQRLGLKTKIHADELGDTGSASLAAELRALSADHLLKVSKKGIRDLAASQTVAVLLPGTAFYLKAAQAPARALIDAGAVVALSTDFNPGTSMCLSLPAVMTIAALYLGMSCAEIFAAVTYNGAKALGLSSRKGTLEKGMDADFAILPFKRFEESYYQFAWAPRPITRSL